MFTPLLGSKTIHLIPRTELTEVHMRDIQIATLISRLEQVPFVISPQTDRKKYDPYDTEKVKYDPLVLVVNHSLFPFVEEGVQHWIRMMSCVEAMTADPDAGTIDFCVMDNIIEILVIHQSFPRLIREIDSSMPFWPSEITPNKDVFREIEFHVSKISGAYF